MAEHDRRVALVTGGGSGMGRETALTLARSGCAVAVAGRRREPLEEVVEEIRQAGGTGLAVTADVSVRAQVEGMVGETVETLGDLHILVNNAGIAAAGPFEEVSEELVHGLVDIDLKGPIFTTQAALPHLKKHRETAGAWVVNISSSVTFMALKNYAVYSAAKAGVDMLTRCLALELAADRIRVNALCPGVVDTPIFATMMPEQEAAGYVAQFDDIVPLGRHGRPRDVAGVVRFLVSEAGDWITGAVLPVDGGLSLGPG